MKKSRFPVHFLAIATLRLLPIPLLISSGLALPADAELEYSGSVPEAQQAMPALRHQVCPPGAAGYSGCELIAVRVIGNWAWVSWRREQKSGATLLQRAAPDWKPAYTNDGALRINEAIAAGIPRQVAEFVIPTPALDLANTGEQLRPEALEALSAWELRIARNAIFARHGRSFLSRLLTAYFRSWPWYQVNPDYSPVLLTDTERANALIILEVETRKGYYPAPEG